MRFVIADGRSGCSPDITLYAGRTAIVEEWFVERNKLPCKCKEAVLLRVTEKAMLFLFKQQELWIPKSLIKFIDRHENKLVE